MLAKNTTNGAEKSRASAACPAPGRHLCIGVGTSLRRIQSRGSLAWNGSNPPLNEGVVKMEEMTGNQENWFALGSRYQEDEVLFGGYISTFLDKASAGSLSPPGPDRLSAWAVGLQSCVPISS